MNKLVYVIILTVNRFLFKKRNSSFIYNYYLEVLMDYKGYLIDLDGTMFRGEEVIEGAKQFIDLLNDRDIPYLFITNNATYTIKQIGS